jgi:hypothetical protein
VAVNQRTSLIIKPWRASTVPREPIQPQSQDAPTTAPRQDDARMYFSNEMQALEGTVDSLIRAAVQVTDVAPLSPLKGMVRFADGAWATALGITGLVVYDGTQWVSTGGAVASIGSTSGYVSYPGGLLDQFGKATYSSGAANILITFPISFTGSPLVAFGITSDATFLYVNSISATNVKFNFSPSAPSGGTMYWRAVGNS